MPMVEATEIRAIVAAACSRPRWSRAAPIISAVRPSPVPGAARPASSHPNPSGATVRALPATTMTSVVITAARRRGPEPSRPSTGVATAPASRVMVRVHWALLRDTPKRVATLVISGAPRLPIAATTSAMNTSDGTSSRVLAGAAGVAVATVTGR